MQRTTRGWESCTVNRRGAELWCSRKFKKGFFRKGYWLFWLHGLLGGRFEECYSGLDGDLPGKEVLLRIVYSICSTTWFARWPIESHSSATRLALRDLWRESLATYLRLNIPNLYCAIAEIQWNLIRATQTQNCLIIDLIKFYMFLSTLCTPFNLNIRNNGKSNKHWKYWKQNNDNRFNKEDYNWQ